MSSRTSQKANGSQRLTARSLAGIGVTVALHIFVVFLLLQLDVVRSAVRARPIMVSLITPERKPEPEVLRKPLPQKPHVQRQPRVEPPPVMTTTVAPAPFVASPPPPEPAPPAPLEVPVAAGPPAPAAPLILPSFNADYLKNPAPAYPAFSRRNREEGKVVLRVFVTEQGAPREVNIRTSSGHALLDDAALEAVRQWHFVPARRGDTPVGAWVLVPITFSLRS